MQFDLGFIFDWYTRDTQRCTRHFSRLIRFFLVSGTPGTPFQRKPSHMRARTRRERCTTGAAKLFSGTDVREPSVVGPIPDMGEKTRQWDAAKEIPMRHQSSGRHAVWLTKSTAASLTLRPSTRHCPVDEARGRAESERQSPSGFLTISTSSTPAMRMRSASPSAAGQRSSLPHPRALRSPSTSTRRSVRQQNGATPKRTHTQRSCPCFGPHKRLDPLWSANRRGS